jgi:soluble lytic murein transglycosylase
MTAATRVTVLAAVLLFGAAAPEPAWAAAEEATENAEQGPAKALSDADEKIYRDAFKAAAQGKWSYARSRASQASDPLLAKALAWFEMSDPGSPATFEERARFVSENSNWPDSGAFQEMAEGAMSDATPDQEVLDWFATREPVTPAGLVRYADALAHTGKEDQATALYHKAWIEGNFGLREERTFLARHGKRLRPEDHLARLDRLLWDGRFDDAHRMLHRVDKGHQALAEARERLRRMEGAVDWAIGKVPDALQNDSGLLYERLRWRRRKDNDDGAKEILDHPPADLVRPEMWWNERAIIARRALAAGNITDAYRLASRHGLTDGPAYFEAEWLSGWIALRFLQDPASAFDHFKNAYASARYPISQARAAYWAGRAAELIPDKPGLAQDWYERAASNPTTYHGQLAEHKLHPDQGLTLPPDPKPTAEDKARFDGREMVAVVRQLGQIGEQRRLRPFILRLQDLAETPAEVALTGRLAVSEGRPDLAVAMSKRAMRSGVLLVKQAYPVPHMPQVRDPEPALVLAMMRQESAFDALAESSAGARGLMQLMPATARQMARSLGVRFSPHRLHSDPAYNVKLGTAYLSGLLSQYDGSYVLALAAYNAGPARLRSWINDNGDPRQPDVDAIDWIEMIPYGETRDYVQRVLENLQVYRLRLGGAELAQTLEKDLHLRN